MSLHIAYEMRKKAKKMAKGGECMAEGGEEMLQDEETPHQEMSPIAKGMKKAFKLPGYAEGGEVEEKASGYQPMPCKSCGHVSSFDHDIENQEMDAEEEDMIGRIMKNRKGYSEGGKVANKDEVVADFEPNEFDEIPLEDDLSFHYTGKNSGDEEGDKHVEEEDRDVVSRIMKSRSKKDRMPRPA